MRFNSRALPSDSVRPPRASARSCSGSNLPLAFIRPPCIYSPISGTSCALAFDEGIVSFHDQFLGCNAAVPIEIHEIPLSLKPHSLTTLLRAKLANISMNR